MFEGNYKCRTCGTTFFMGSHQRAGKKLDKDEIKTIKKLSRCATAHDLRHS